jgi:hypothetical protein
MAETAAPAWSLRGEYFENCNCTVACPCIFSTAAPFTSSPTEGACEVAFAFHLDEGTFGDVSLAGLNVGMIARTPGPMIEGNWTVALYVDERADQRQQEALQAIFAGAAGGVMGGFAPLIPDIMQLAVRPVPSVMGEDQEMVAINAHPFAPAGVAMAVGEEGSTWSDYGLRWDNSGRNGHYGAITWSNQ